MTKTHGLCTTAALLGLVACATQSDDALTGSRPTATPPHVAAIGYADDGLPFMVRGQLGRASAPIISVDDATTALAAALPPLTAKFQVSADALVPTRVQHDELGMTHVRYAQQKDGLPVVGGDFVVHLDADRVIASVNGSIRDGGPSAADARVSADTAREVARNATSNGNVDASAADLMYVIATGDGAMHLAWQVEVTGRGELLDDLVYVDALTGSVVDRHPQVFTAKNREIRNGNNCAYPFGCGTTALLGTEASPPTSDVVAMAAFENTGLTWDCYQTLFNRDSYDNAGGKLKSIVHVVFQTQSGTTGNNAAWTGNQMVYGDGDGQLMYQLARSLDVTAHELTHGVTAATAKLAYQNESGALNEGMSDIMGAVCESWHDGAVSADTWLVGEDIFTPNTPGDALRYMANPTADASLYPPQLGGSRDYYPERYQGADDNGGVHLNSGIANLAFELLVVGGKHPRNKTTFNVPGIGIQKAGAIFQRALTQGYFTSNTNFTQARTQTEMVATQLYPGSTSTAVGFAWAAVGIGQPPTPSDTTPPMVSITSPTDGATVNAGFTVSVQASDDVGVDHVELAIDGQSAGTSMTAPYMFTTPATLAAGSHTLTATAYDLFNQASATVTVTIASGAQCEHNSDCQAGEQCKDGTCVAPTSCTTDTDCGSGETCTAGICVPPGGSDNGDGGGCGCAVGTDRSVTVGNLLLLLGTLFFVGRRRR
jgi:Cys-rich repeat protein